MSAIAGASAGVKDMAGQVFGLLTVVERAGSVGTRAAWRCVCQCGNELVAAGTGIRYGLYKSCGCTRKTSLSAARKKHGARRSADPATKRLYAAWCGMKARCRNPKHKDFKYYGALGIDVCERWESFDAFVSDMGARPDGKTLDRKEGALGYSPENCRWATHKEQRANQRRSKS